MKDLFQTRSVKILIFILVLLIAIMLYSATTGGKQNIFSSIFSFITTPVQKISSLLSGSADELAGDLDNPADIQKQNEALKDKVRELTSSLIDYDQAMRENELYRQLFGMKEKNQDFIFAKASVIARESGDVFRSFTIDQGSINEVELYDPVLTVDGLVGYITEVGPVSSKVTTIIDASIETGAVDIRTEDQGTVTGDATLAKQGMTKIKYLARDCDVTAGDIIVTTGLGGIFPKNLVIGEVVEVKPEAQDISLYAVIRPAADVMECRDVFVLTSFAGQGLVDPDALSDDGTASQ